MKINIGERTIFLTIFFMGAITCSLNLFYHFVFNARLFSWNFVVGLVLMWFSSKELERNKKTKHYPEESK